MFEELKKIYADVIGVDTADISLKNKVSELKLSSLGLIQLVCALEDTYEIEITNAELKSLKTVQDIVRLIEKKVIK